MAYEWVDQAIKNNKSAVRQPQVAPLPTAAPPQAQPQAQSMAPSAQVAAPQASQVQKQPEARPLFSGNLWDNAMDLLSIPRYGYAGFLKGGYGEIDRQKTSGEWANKNISSFDLFGKQMIAGAKNILPSIQSRTDVGREDKDVNVGERLGIKSKEGQAVYNLALSLATPDLPIGKILSKGSKVIKAIPGAEKITGLATQVTNKAYDFAKGNKFISGAIEKTVNPYFRNPEAGKILENTKSAIRGRLAELNTMVQDAVKGLRPEEQRAIGRALEGKTQSVFLEPRLREIANQFKSLAEQIGQESVKTGLLNAEQFAKYKGKYMPHIWAEMTKGDAVGDALSVSGQFSKKRKGATGFIEEFSAPVLKGLGTEIKDNEVIKAFNTIAGKYGVSNYTPQEAQALIQKGYKYVENIGKGRGGEMFNGMLLPSEVVDYVTRTFSKKSASSLDKLTNIWKAGKTVANPAYHVRNMISNQILSDLQTGRGLPATVIDYVQSAFNYFGKGNQQYVQEARKAGLIKHQALGKAVDELIDISIPELQKKDSVLKTIFKAPGQLQNITEDTAKLNVFTEFRKRGASVQEAMAKAEEAIFSPYRLNQQERAMIGNIIPFYSFTRQAVPFIAKTMVNNPERVTKYAKAKTAIESLTPEAAAENKSLPDYTRGQIRLPMKVDGKTVRLDPTYIYPWGNVGEGDLSQGKLPMGLSLNPFAMEIAQQLLNKDLYYQQDIAKSNIPEKATKQRIEHAARTVLPQLYTTIGEPITGLPESRGKLSAAFSGQPDFAGRTRNKAMAVLDALGIKLSALDPAEQAKFRRYDKQSKIKSIQSERRTVVSDKRISQQDKTDILRALDEEMRKVLQSN